MRILSNGDIVFPARGNPPHPLQGYKRDSRDPYLFHPILTPCGHRGKIYRDRRCSGFKLKIPCSFFSKQVSMVDCLKCEEKPKMFTIVSYYTRNTPYEQLAPGFIKSCKEHKVPFAVAGVKNLGSWQKNTQYKAEFMLKMHKHYYGPLVYIDIDGKIQAYPKLFEELDCDFACHFKNGHELLSGTLYMANNEITKELCERWIAKNKTKPETWDQRTLQEVVNGFRGSLRLKELPPSYCQIFDSMKHHGAPVIEHFQASRNFRRKIV